METIEEVQTMETRKTIKGTKQEFVNIQIDTVEKENKKLVDARRKQMEKVEKMMLKSIELELQIISENFLPEDITAKQLNQIIKIIE